MIEVVCICLVLQRCLDVLFSLFFVSEVIVIIQTRGPPQETFSLRRVSEVDPSDPPPSPVYVEAYNVAATVATMNVATDECLHVAGGVVTISSCCPPVSLAPTLSELSPCPRFHSSLLFICLSFFLFVSQFFL